MTADRSTVLRCAGLPLPVLLLAMVGFWLAKPTWAYAPAPLMVALNLVFVAPAALTVAVLMGRGFRRRGALELLWIGSGVLLWALAGLAAAGFLGQGANLPTTIFNTGTALAAFCHLVGVVWAMRAGSAVPAARRGWWIAGAYAAVPAVVAALTWARWTGPAAGVLCPGPGRHTGAAGGAVGGAGVVRAGGVAGALGAARAPPRSWNGTA
jgi:hypothetical protein